MSKPGTTATYKYDGLGRRTEKNVNGVVTRYTYDGEDIGGEYDGSNSIKARYTHGTGIDEPLIVDRGGTPYLYHTDGLGSITEITNSTGTVVQRYVYDSFGQIVSQSGSLTNPYTYTGREYDSESGLYYYRARYYDARIGRFLQEDPIGFNGGDINLYAYVGNNPINDTDPSGLQRRGINTPQRSFNECMRDLIKYPTKKDKCECICGLFGGSDPCPCQKDCEECISTKATPEAFCECACKLSDIFSEETEDNRCKLLCKGFSFR